MLAVNKLLKFTLFDNSKTLLFVIKLVESRISEFHFKCIITVDGHQKLMAPYVSMHDPLLLLEFDLLITRITSADLPYHVPECSGECSAGFNQIFWLHDGFVPQQVLIQWAQFEEFGHHCYRIAQSHAVEFYDRVGLQESPFIG
jgi:hypothetical protein